ncbi:hypothetical protein AVEN_880-1 [Araneus ventricosus]|uniref:Uncharacterized protein n=1 Tax=Araneus ventricosus TaxID=182803 RepID=A0A4Y2DTV8_ARAVE|nr:hypothetical protein AVEN_880-1 [Araneus ventricosus]
MLSFKAVNVWTPPRQTLDYKTGKSRMRLDPGRMGMENVVYRMLCVVQEKGDHHIEGSSMNHIEGSSRALQQRHIFPC